MFGDSFHEHELQKTVILNAVDGTVRTVEAD
jgi:hypothetical protein